MSDPLYYVQKAVYERLVATPAVVALVPVADIEDRSSGAETVFPCILLGEGQMVDEGTSIARKVTRVYSTWHLWTKETNLTGVKHIGGAFRDAIRSARFTLDGGFHCTDLKIDDTRYLRDPSGENGHGIITINALVSEA